MNLKVWLISIFATASLAQAEWITVYTEDFEKVPAGTKTGAGALANWEQFSAAGTVHDGQPKKAGGHFLVPQHGWSSFNQGPIFNLDLAATPHDRVLVSFNLYTLGDWRGLQATTGGPAHRLMFFDSKAEPRFGFSTCFASNAKYKQSWPEKMGAKHPAGKGGHPAPELDVTGRFKGAMRWPVQFEYASKSKAMRFTFLCGAAAGSGTQMPPFGIDDVKVEVRSTAPRIVAAHRPEKTSRPPAAPGAVTFNLKEAGRVSLAIYQRGSKRQVRELLRAEPLKAGGHRIPWDGLDQRGRPVPAGDYEWRLARGQGFTARYITTVGINPPGGEHPQPRRSWVGDHLGAGLVDVDDSGVFVGSPITEGMMMLLKANRAMDKVLWRREQFYQSGQLKDVAAAGSWVFMAHPNGRVRRLHRDTGAVQVEWMMKWGEHTTTGMDAEGKFLALACAPAGGVRWLDPATGKVTGEAKVPNASRLALLADGRALVAAGKALFEVSSGGNPKRVAELPGTIGALDHDSARRETWVAVDGHTVLRLDAAYRIARRYGGRPRPQGPYDPQLFAGIHDVAADLQGGFYVGEPSVAPRRLARFDRNGKLLGQWIGGQSFYVNAAFDPNDATRLYGIAAEGWVNVYRIDFATGEWRIEETYAVGRLGDSLFPFTGSFRVVRRAGETFLYHRHVPSVVRLDAKQRRAVPVAIAGTVRNSGRSMFQFAGTGRDGFPKPWVTAAEHHGFKDLKQAPKLFSWADTDGDGEFDPAEFHFYPNAKGGVSFHNPGDFNSRGDYLGAAPLNSATAMVNLSSERWEGPRQTAPRWNWDRLKPVGELLADGRGWGSPRGVTIAPDGSASVAYQAGLMIRDHGQYEGGGWPEAGVTGSRVLAFDSAFRPKFAVGRQSKWRSEANTGVLFYPMQTLSGPGGAVVVNDQTKQPAQAWTADGLYLGGFFDHRTDDGRPDGFYGLHGDDNQGGQLVTTKDDRTFWLMPYQGHNRLYEITGWQHDRQTGPVRVKATKLPALEPTGLNADYYQEANNLLSVVERPIFYERFSAERHANKVKPHYKVVWDGYVEPPFTDRYQFHSLLGAKEQVAVWLDGQLVYAAGLPKRVDEKTPLTAGHRHRLRIEYINPDGRAELKLLWSSRTMDSARVDKARLFPAR